MSETQPDIARELLRGRLFMGVVTALGGGAVLVLAPRWLGAATGGAWALLELACLVQMLRFTRTIDAPGADLMFRSGQRVDGRRFAALVRTELLEGPYTYACVVLAVCSVRSLPGILVALLTLVPASLGWATGRQRRHSLWLNRGIRALHDGDLATVEKAVAALAKAQGPFWEGGRSLAADLAAQRGDLAGAREIQESTWNGGHDASALGVALQRLEHGDPELAAAIVASTGSDAMDRYARHRVRVHRALIEGRYAEVVAETDDLSIWPPNLADPLEVYRVAARRALGEEAVLPPHLARRYAYWEGWYPGVHAALVGAARPAVEPLPAMPRGRVFVEAPIDRRLRGFVPFEWLGVVSGRRRTVVHVVLLPVLFGLGLLLGGLLLLVRLAGEPVSPILSVAAFVAVLALGVSIGGGLRLLLRYMVRRGERSAVLGDGEPVDLEQMGLWAAAEGVPGFIAGLVIALVPVLVEWAIARTWYGVGLGVALGLFFWWASGRLAIGAYASMLAHGPDVARWRRFAERMPRWLLLGDGQDALLGLARLWSGDGEGARAAWERGRIYGQRNKALIAWLDAASGEIDVDALLDRAPPESVGPAYRAGVTLALGALAKGREVGPERREALRATAARVPNRFGDLLAALVDRLEDPDAPLPADLLWFDAVWPGLWRRDG